MKLQSRLSAGRNEPMKDTDSGMNLEFLILREILTFYHVTFDWHKI